jgi:UDP-glucose 4-epimerase
MRVLVTGGAGFIGSNLVDALIEHGHEVAVLDDFSTGKEENLEAAARDGAIVRRADIRDAGAVAGVVDEVRPQVIFHLAAQVDVRRSVADPRFDARTNVEGTINVLDAARGIGARVVNVSTGGAIYGDVDTIPTAEDVEPLPEAPYGQSKFCAERYVALYRRLFGLSGVTARLGNVYGPRQDPLGEAGVIAIFCGLLERGEQPTIFGSGDQTRDYIYIADVVEALLALLAEPAARGEFNIGTGRATSVRDIIAALAPFADGTFEPRFAPARDGEIEHSCLDVTRAREELGWTARTELADGLRRTLEWTRAPSAAAAVAG